MNGLKPLVIQKWSELYQLCKQHGIDLAFISGFRSKEDQDKLYAQGRTTAGSIVTNAKGGQSFHNYGIAFDCCPKKNGQPDWSAPQTVWDLMGQLGESIGLEHGDRGYVDLPHFQLRFNYSLQDFQNNKVDWTKWEINKEPTPVESTVTTSDPVNKLIDEAIEFLNSKRK